MEKFKLTAGFISEGMSPITMNFNVFYVILFVLLLLPVDSRQVY